MSKLTAGILGATGIVGQQFIKLLEGHPFFEVTELYASEASVGKRYDEATDWIIEGEMPHDVQSIEVKDADQAPSGEVNLLFSALPASVAGPLEKKAANLVPVFSNASAHRTNDQVPILVPEINPEHIQLVAYQQYGKGFIVTNSNCSTAGLVFGLKPLMPYGIRHVIVTTMQAVSGAGRKGVASLDIIGNVIPWIGNEEEKIQTEPRKVLGILKDGRISPAEMQIDATCTRVPVLNGHLESIVVSLEEDISQQDVISAFSMFRGAVSDKSLPTAPKAPIIVLDDEMGPQPRKHLVTDDDPIGMAVKIGRIRKSAATISFLLLVHNTVRGAAGASILNAEYAYAMGYLEEVER